MMEREVMIYSKKREGQKERIACVLGEKENVIMTNTRKIIKTIYK